MTVVHLLAAVGKNFRRRRYLVFQDTSFRALRGGTPRTGGILSRDAEAWSENVYILYHSTHSTNVKYEARIMKRAALAVNPRQTRPHFCAPTNSLVASLVRPRSGGLIAPYGAGTSPHRALAQFHTLPERGVNRSAVSVGPQKRSKWAFRSLSR